MRNKKTTIGFGPSATMQRDQARNKAQLTKRKSLKEIKQDHNTNSEQGINIDKKFTPEEAEQFKLKLAQQKAKNKRNFIIILGSLTAIGIAIIIALFI